MTTLLLIAAAWVGLDLLLVAAWMLRCWLVERRFGRPQAPAPVRRAIRLDGHGSQREPSRPTLPPADRYFGAV